MSTLRVDNLTGVSGSGVISMPSTVSLYASGHLIQTKTASSGPARQTINSLTPVAVDGLSISFTPINANSLIVVKAQISTSASYVSAHAIYKDGNPSVSTTGFTNNCRANMNITTYINADTNDNIYSFPIMWSETAGSTLARTYQVYATAQFSASVRILNINNRNSNDMASFSHLTVMEYAR